MDQVAVPDQRVALSGYRPLSVTLTGFRGIRDGLGRDEITMDLQALAGDAQLVAIAGENGRGKTTLMDNLHPYLVMPSRAGKDGMGDFSYYDHVCLPESKRDLVWEHQGVKYRTQLVFRVNGKRKTEAYLLQDAAGAWTPTRLADGTVSDGKVETYERCVHAILGSPETFFTSVFSAQGKRQLSAYKNAEIKTLLADLLGLEQVRAQGALAAETARLLKSGLGVLRQQQATSEASIRTLQTEAAGVADAAGQVAAATTAKDSAAAEVGRARDGQASLQRLADVAAAASQQRSELAEKRQAARSTLADSSVRLNERDRREVERARNLEQRRTTRKRQHGERRSLLVGNLHAQRRAVANAQRAGWAAERLPLAEAIAERRGVQAAACQARADRAAALGSTLRDLLQQLTSVENLAGQAVLRHADLSRRFGLTAQVPCAGTGLQGQCMLLGDAREAQALLPSVDAQIADYAQQKAALGTGIDAARVELATLAHAAELRNEAERRHEASVARAGRLAVLAARTRELDQARVALAATEAELLMLPEAAVEETPEEATERVAVEQARGAIATERQQATADCDAEVARLDAALAALPAPADGARVATAAGAVAAAQRAMRECEDALVAAIRRQERLAAVQAQLAEAQARVASISGQAKGVERQLATWVLLAKCLSNDGVIALDIDDAGPTLAALANDLLLACYGHRFTVEIRTLVESARGEAREGFDILVHDARSNESKSVSLMSGGERVWINECLTRAIALYLHQNAGRRYDTLFCDEADGPLDASRKRMFMDMKRAVLKLGGYRREFFVSQTPELTAMADAVIDMDALAVKEGAA